MWWAIVIIGVLAAGAGVLVWSWRHVDEIVPIPFSGPVVGFQPCLGAIAAPGAGGPPDRRGVSAEGELADRLLAGRMPADGYRAELERLAAAADVGRPVRIDS